MRTRDRKSAFGLPPRMEARQRKDGKWTYRYHPPGGKPINLGTDRDAAIRAEQQINGRTSDHGTFDHVWRLYQESPQWRALSERTRKDYVEHSKPLLKVFGGMRPMSLTQQMCRQYMAVERKGKVRGNREMALLGNLMVVAIDCGFASSNPTSGLKRLQETPRATLPVDDEFSKFVEWLKGRGRQWSVIAAMAQFAAKTGARRAEFLSATVHQVKDGVARLKRAKQRRGSEVIDVIELDRNTVAVLASVQREGCDALFPTRSNRPYTEAGFKAMWAKAMSKAIEGKVVTQRFTFHDLRAYYVSEYRAANNGELPQLHKNPAVTTRLYDRRREILRRSAGPVDSDNSTSRADSERQTQTRKSNGTK